MAREVRTFANVIAIGSTPAAPVVTQMQFPPREVTEIEVRVPPGPRGEVGFRIGSSGTQIMPFDLGAWIITDDEVIHWPLEGQHQSGSWEFTAYNTGQYAHTITVRFLVDLPPGIGPPAGVSAGPAVANGTSLGQVSGSGTVPPLPDLQLPLPPPLPSLPGAPSLPPVPGLPPPGFTAPPLTVAEDDSMRFARLVRPDGTVDFVVLLSDTTAVHWQEFGDGRPIYRDSPPGNWVAIGSLFTWQGQTVLRGIGRDGAVWQTRLPQQSGGVWSNPEPVL